MRNPAPILLALLLSLASRGGAQQLATKFTEVEGITEYRLPNGLRVLLFPEYNTERPHRGLGQRTPSEYAAVLRDHESEQPDPVLRRELA